MGNPEINPTKGSMMNGGNRVPDTISMSFVQAVIDGNVERFEDLFDDDNLNRATIDAALKEACKHGRNEFVTKLLDKGIESKCIEMAFWCAAYGGHLDTLKILRDVGATNLNSAMKIATCYGYNDIVEKCIEWGADDFEGGLWNAAAYGQIDLMQMYRDRDARDINGALRSAALNAKLDAIQLCLKWGADDLKGAIKNAHAIRNTNIVKYLTSL